MKINMNEKFNLLVNIVLKHKIYAIVVMSVVLLSSILLFFIIPQEPKKPEALSELISMYEKQKQSKGTLYVIQQLKRCAREYPKSYYIHLKLGKYFLEVNDINLAKVNLYRALELSNYNDKKHSAAFLLADIYSNETQFKLAEEFILPFKESNSKNVYKSFGDFYYKWGESLENTYLSEAIRKYKKAYDYYNKAQNIGYKKSKYKLVDLYNSLASFYLKEGNTAEAKELLKLSLKLKQNSRAYYELGLLYEKEEALKAINYFIKAFKLNKNIAEPTKYINLLVEHANISAENGEWVKAKYYRHLASRMKKYKLAKYNKNTNNHYEVTGH